MENNIGTKKYQGEQHRELYWGEQYQGEQHRELYAGGCGQYQGEQHRELHGVEQYQGEQHRELDWEHLLGRGEPGVVGRSIINNKLPQVGR